MNYTMIIEQGEAAWWGYIPDAPGCAIGGETLAELLVVAPDVLAAHLEGCAPPRPALSPRF